jgi:hypothetical protein
MYKCNKSSNGQTKEIFSYFIGNFWTVQAIFCAITTKTYIRSSKVGYQSIELIQTNRCLNYYEYMH